jgi:uncharacterized repeat protein (TIGR01451 family)
LPGGTPVPTGTVVLAVDPQGVVCGATMVWQPGQFGLLACYADDPQTTDVDEGGVPGDSIQLMIWPDDILLGEGVWMGHGGRWQVAPGAPPSPPAPVVDLVITKEVTPTQALPGQAITYTVMYWNAGNAPAHGAIVTDVVPAEISVTGVEWWGAPITQTAGGGTLAWQVADLDPGAGGIITVTGILSPALAAPLTITNTAVISVPLESQPANNLAQAVLDVIEGLARLWRVIVHAAL